MLSGHMADCDVCFDLEVLAGASWKTGERWQLPVTVLFKDKVSIDASVGN